MKPEGDIILHCCCAPCATYPTHILGSDYEPHLFFYNPNIYPVDEYMLRSEEIVSYGRKIGRETIVGSYDVWKFESAIAGLELLGEGSERCGACFTLRFEQTAKLCRKKGIQKFTSTLSISPHKNFALIKEMGEKIADSYGCIFVPINFRKNNGFTISSQMSREAGMYRQNYCGCRWSYIETKERQNRRDARKQKRK